MLSLVRSGLMGVFMRLDASENLHHPTAVDLGAILGPGFLGLHTVLCTAELGHTVHIEWGRPMVVTRQKRRIAKCAHCHALIHATDQPCSDKDELLRECPHQNLTGRLSARWFKVPGRRRKPSVRHSLYSALTVYLTTSFIHPSSNSAQVHAT